MADYAYDALYGDDSWPTAVRDWLHSVRPLIQERMSLEAHGKMGAWQQAIANLPNIPVTSINLQNGVRTDGEPSADQLAQLRQQLMHLHPWRKGPFHLFGLHLDTEWRSDWKWARLAEAITPLTGRTVLDVGSGNGYYGWRMAGAGARWVIGLDPFLVYVMQFHAVQKYIGRESAAVQVLPLGIENLAPHLASFDTVFSMGVLYHRRSPFDHLIELREAVRAGGELVLETLVIDGKLGEVLVPEGRYAQMRNVWFIPSCLTLESWLRKAGWRDVQLVDVTPTTTAEQRATPWMTFHSLANFLREDGRTVEGHPAPVRAVLVAQK